MKYAFYIGLPLLLVIMIITAQAQDTPDSLLESHLWENRVVVLLTTEEDNTTYIEQRRALASEQDELKERDIVIYDIVRYSFAKQDGSILPHVSATAFFDAFHDMIDSHDFTLLLIGKDGDVKRIEHNFIAPDIMFQQIDAMPMRQRDIRK